MNAVREKHALIVPFSFSKYKPSISASVLFSAAMATSNGLLGQVKSLGSVYSGTHLAQW